MVNKKKPLVSAIVSTYNSEKFIRGKIEDLLQQSIIDRLEIIIVNSGSQQNEDAIIKEYVEKWPNIKYIRTEERETIYKAWNRGIKIASGEFITNANTDDRLKNDAYELLSGYLLENPDVFLVYANQLRSEIPNQTYNPAVQGKIRFPNYNHFYQMERCIIGSQPMWRNSLHTQDNMWFDEVFEVCGDHEFELKISEKYKIKHLDIYLGVFYKSKDRTNKEYENLERNRAEVFKIREKYIKSYFSNSTNEEYINCKKYFKKYRLIPIPLLYIVKKVDNKLFNSIYPRWIFYSIEFIYYFSIQIYLYKNDFEKALKVARRFLRYRKSDLIHSERIKILERLTNDK